MKRFSSSSSRAVDEPGRRSVSDGAARPRGASNAVAIVLLCVGALAATGLLVARAHALGGISHDDGISYLAATGHQDAYARRAPRAAWVPARDWKAFWRPERVGCLRTI